MKCTVLSSAFNSSLSLVVRAVSLRSSMPILSNVLLVAKDNKLIVTGTTLSLTISETLTATVLEEGSITVPAHLLYEFLSAVAAGNEECTLVTDSEKESLTVFTKAHRATFHGLDAGEFPPLPIGDIKSTISIPSSILETGIVQTLIAVSTDTTFPAMTGVLLVIEGNVLTLAATDRHRLAVKHIPIENTTVEERVVVPAKGLAEVIRAINEKRDIVQISFSERKNQIFFNMEGVEISVRLIEGGFPSFEAAIPEETTTTVMLSTLPLLQEVKAVSVLAGGSTHPLRLKIEEGKMILFSQTAEVGDDEVPLEADIEGKDLFIALNAKLLMEALAVIDTEKVKLCFSSFSSPCLVKKSDGDDYICLIMPLKTWENET